MILTITPNPSVDRTIFVESLEHGAVNRSDRSRSEPSGKGVNVSLALFQHGHDTAAILPVGGSVGAQLSQMLKQFGLTTAQVEIGGEVRSNVSLVEGDGTVTKINEAGPQLTDVEVDALVDAVLDRLHGASWLACCGSLPAGAPTDLYAKLAKEGRRRGIRVAVDTSGEALTASLSGRPTVIKPNNHELAEIVARPLTTLGDIIDAAQQVRRAGAGAVLASLGADGAVLVDDTGVYHGEAHVAKVVSAVGAGDALLAGYLAGDGKGVDALRSALAWGAAAVQHEGTLFTAHDDAVDVTIHDAVNRARVISESE